MSEARGCAPWAMEWIRPAQPDTLFISSITIGEMTAWHRASATSLIAAYAAGSVTPVDVLDAVLARLDAVNPALNAVIATDPAAARRQAEASAARWRSNAPLGALDGIPFTVKDNIVTAALPTRWGCPVFRDFQGERDELPVARMLAGGAVLVGKTNVPELTLMGYTDNTLFGPTGNPWNPALTPGGSSGGAVSAVAAGIGPVALGTDGGGSIRRPASHTGLVGLKPTPGRIPRCDGLPAILLDFEVIGPIARTVGDIWTVTRALAARDARDPASRMLPDLGAMPPARPSRILYVPRFGAHPVDPEIAASVAAAARHMADLGHEVSEGPPPFDPDEVALIQSTVSAAGLAWLMRERQASPAAAILQQTAERGAAMPAADLFQALDDVGRLRRTMSVFFETTDVLMTPSAAALPWPKTESHPPVIAGQPVGPRGHAVFTAFANAGGLPGLALPCERSAAGLPIGFQLVGPYGADAALLALGLQYEAAHPWADAWPAG
ncbi:MAG TPA: amidase [Rhodopila sp.]|uniref:amidase n=1 Tax=Rhodopila sp. TaxID=2480087 RepID=UPI002CBC1BA4|nr:amidase [Rhodopila sp.]HVY14591.1 amidase [Rhodopila sp.]